MIVVEIKSNIRNLIKYLGEVSKNLEDLSVPLKLSALTMIKSIDKNFRVQGRPEKWKPLAKSTVKRRRRGSSSILQDTGTLKNSISSQALVKMRGKNTISIGTTNAYAAVHNFGLTKTKHKAWGKKTKPYTHTIPQRKFMLFQEEDKRIIDKTFIDFIGKALTEKVVEIPGSRY